MHAIVQHRKALLTAIAEPYAPVRDPELAMHTPLVTCGGDAFIANMKRLAHGDCGLAGWIEVLSMGTSPHACAVSMHAADH